MFQAATGDIDTFFTKYDDSEHAWRCNCRTVRKVPGSVYYVTHVSSQYPAEYRNFRNDIALRVGASTNSSSFEPTTSWKNKTVHLNGCVSFIVHGLQPFSHSENKVGRANVNYDPISVKHS